MARANIRLLGFPEGLTGENGNDTIVLSNEGEAPLPTEKGHMMARKSKQATPVEEVEEVEDEIETLEPEVDDEVDDTETTKAESNGEMLSSKAAATLIGTDGRTLRKFLRKKHGLVGQGQRWEIDPDDIDQLKAEFAEWGGGKGSRSDGEKDKAAAKKKTKGKAATPPPADDELDDDEIAAIEEIDDLDQELEELPEEED